MIIIAIYEKLYFHSKLNLVVRILVHIYKLGIKHQMKLNYNLNWEFFLNSQALMKIITTFYRTQLNYQSYAKLFLYRPAKLMGDDKQ